MTYVTYQDEPRRKYASGIALEDCLRSMSPSTPVIVLVHRYRDHECVMNAFFNYSDAVSQAERFLSRLEFDSQIKFIKTSLGKILDKTSGDLDYDSFDDVDFDLTFHFLREKFIN